MSSIRFAYEYMLLKALSTPQNFIVPRIIEKNIFSDQNYFVSSKDFFSRVFFSIFIHIDNWTRVFLLDLMMLLFFMCRLKLHIFVLFIIDSS